MRGEGSPLSGLLFGVLGPVCAWRDGQELDLGPGKQRAVLAVLLLHANRPVQASEIAEAVWGADEPPANGANVVQKRVSGLRSAFEPERPPREPGQLLSLTDAGYLLRVGPDQLDTDRLRSHLDRARAARAAGRPGEALRELHDGLRLWRGTPLAGLTGPFFEAERRRLTEIHVSTLEDAMEVELELGRHAHVLPELLRLVAEHPLRERPRYLLMQALARSGRQAEALAAYRDARRYLVEELGIEPGAELQELHQRILTAEATPPAAANGSLRSTVDKPASGPLQSAVDQPVNGSLQSAVDRPASGSLQSAVDRPASGRMHHPVAPIVPVLSTRRRIASTWVILLPTLGIGLVSWAPAAYAAVRLRNGRYWIGVAAQIAALLALVALVVLPRSVLTDTLGPLILFASWAAATTQGFWIRARILDQFADPATVAAIACQVRRQQAYQLLTFHPQVARELGIGRPDLPRQFDDGGLIDINSVPVHVFAVLPGVGAERAQQIVSERQRIGPFASIDDLVARLLLPPKVVDPLRDVLIAL